MESWKEDRQKHRNVKLAHHSQRGRRDKDTIHTRGEKETRGEAGSPGGQHPDPKRAKFVLDGAMGKGAISQGVSINRVAS